MSALALGTEGSSSVHMALALERGQHCTEAALALAGRMQLLLGAQQGVGDSGGDSRQLHQLGSA